MSKSHYHFFANGDDAKGFILDKKDYCAAFNRMGICTSYSGITMLSFSVEDTHPHALIYGTEEDCDRFKTDYESLTKHYITASRGSLDGVKFECTLYRVSDPDYLRNVGIYTIIQPTKDGKSIMPYDYRWGTGSMYFRSGAVPIWHFDEKGKYSEPLRFGSLTVRQKRGLLSSKRSVPSDWLVCNGLLLPSNYVDVKAFESLYQTANRFRVFLGNSRRDQEEVIKKMAEMRGVCIEDLEARKICREKCQEMFSNSDVRKLNPQERLSLASSLRRSSGLSCRQLAAVTHLPESEIRKYLF